MKPSRLAVLVCAAFCASAIAADNPFGNAFKGKIKEGLYEYKMEMDMGQVPGLPPGMGKQSMTMQHCVTQQDIEKGAFSKGRDGKSQENCKIENFKMSGNTASYTMVCNSRGGDMTADAVMTFVGDGYNMDMKMNMNQGGRPMQMSQHAEARYKGACTK